MRYETVEKIQRVTGRMAVVFCRISLLIGAVILLAVVVTKVIIWLNESVFHWGDLGIAIMGGFSAILLASLVVALAEEE